MNSHAIRASAGWRKETKHDAHGRNLFTLRGRVTDVVACLLLM
jgi:hypothetical protein